MVVSYTSPGVYIEEVPSTVRTIMGVPTSLAAFIGRTARGPVNTPIIINGYGDFDRVFGGLWKESRLGFAVRDYFRNGGIQAVVVRLHREATCATLQLGGLELEAAYPGTWSDGLRMRIDHDVDKDTVERYQGKVYEFFNLTVRDTTTGAVEQFRNVSVVENNTRYIANVLENESQLVRVNNLDDHITRPAKHADPDPTKRVNIWDPNEVYSSGTSGTASSDGVELTTDEFTGAGKEMKKEGLYALENTDIFNILCIPPYNTQDNADTEVLTEAALFCERHRAILLVDPPAEWRSVEKARDGLLEYLQSRSKNVAIYFPRLMQSDPFKADAQSAFAPCGAVAGILARTDAQRGVWKAPAGTEAMLVGVNNLSVALTDADSGILNPLGINCLRTLPAVGRVVWGARTVVGDDRLASEWKYLPVRRLALFIEESLYRGTQWVVFEPNDEPLWAQIRLNLGAYMHSLFRQGAFQGKMPRDAYFVKCDRETTTPDDINRGIVNIHVGFAPLKPAEFVVIKLQQMAGQLEI